MRHVAVVLATTAPVLSACGDGSPSEEAASRPQVVTGAFRCPDPSVKSPRDRGSDRLPGGATAALLCYRATDSVWTAPDGPLTAHVDRLITLANTRPTAHYDGCSAVGAPAWSMVIRYPDGIRTIEGDDGGCGTMLIGQTERFSAYRAYRSFLEALGAQRRTAHPPGLAVRPVMCPSRLETAQLSVVAQPDRATNVTWCVRQRRHWVETGAASDRQLRILRHEFRPPIAGTSLSGRVSECRGLPDSSYSMVVGRDPWGEPFAIDFFCDGYRIFPTGQDRAEFVRMSAAMRRLVAAHVTKPALRP